MFACTIPLASYSRFIVFFFLKDLFLFHSIIQFTLQFKIDYYPKIFVIYIVLCKFYEFRLLLLYHLQYDIAI